MAAHSEYKSLAGQHDGASSSEVAPELSLSTHPPILTAEQKEELGGCDFPFENIVCEGGGNKGLSLVGTFRVLEELGFMKNIRRFGGASAGAMATSLLAVGYNSHDIEGFLRGDMEKLFLDARFGVLSLLPNMLWSYGWHPGNRIYHWFGERVREKMGNADLTFGELYKRTGRELCIAVTNMNSMDCAYCHVKTTPDLAIRRAVKMSACFPGVFCPVQVKMGKWTDFFIDGGLLCNYPIHCFDGWYLSMEAKDSFLRRAQPIEDLPKLWDPAERFGAKNNKTLGLLMYAGEEREVMKDDLKRRFEKQIKPSEILEYPKTTLAKKRVDKIKEQEEVVKKQKVLTGVLGKFLKVLADNDIDDSGTITLEEMEKAMSKENSEFTVEDKKLLFGDNYTDVKTLFQRLDRNANGEVTFHELLAFAERQGLALLDHFRGYRREDITCLTGFFGSIMNSLLLNMKRIFVQGSDLNRTVGIDTGYLDTLDFKMEPEDQDYLVEQGKLGCLAFLRDRMGKTMTSEN